MKTEDYILAGLGIAGLGGIAYTLTKKPPRPPVPPAPGYPKTISRAPYSFTVNNAQEETQMNDFLGIHPSGSDIDTYLLGLDSEPLHDWFVYWRGLWSSMGRSDICDFVREMYSKYTAPPEYPKTISRGVYSFVVNNIQEEHRIKDMLGIDPSGVDIDTYLSGLTPDQLEQWKDYWTRIWVDLNRTDIFAFVGQMYGKYAQEAPPVPPVPPAPGYPKTISRAPYSFTVNNAQEETQMNDFLGIHPSGSDIDTYLSGLTTTQLDNWKNYWVGLWSNLSRGDIISFVHQMYGKYTAPSEYPKTISRGVYSFVVNNIQEEPPVKDLLGIDPPGVDIDTYLSSLTTTQLNDWKNYWVGIWSNLSRGDIVSFVHQMYSKYIALPGLYLLTIITTNKQTGAVVPDVNWSLGVYVHAIYGYELVAEGQTNSSGRSVVYIPSSPPGTADGRYKIQFSTTTYVGLGSPYIQFSMPASPHTLKIALEPREPTPPTEQTITIHVQDWDTEAPIRGAMVDVNGVTQSTSGSGDVQFRLMTGSYSATIKKGDYETETQGIHVAHRDKTYTIDMQGEGAPPVTEGGYLEVTVFDVGGNPIEGIPVVFAQSITNYNKTFYTNSSGKATSGELMSGEYAQFRVNPGAYFGFVDSGWTQVSILPDRTTKREIELSSK